MLDVVQKQGVALRTLAVRARRVASRILFTGWGAMLWQLAPTLLLMILLFVVPLIYLVYMSMWKYDPAYFGPTALTLENYYKLLGMDQYRAVIVRTVWMGVQVSTLCTLIGYPFALILARTGIRGKSWWLFVLLTPLFVGGVVRSFGWVIMLSRNGPLSQLAIGLGLTSRELLHTDVAVVIGLVSALLPFMVTAVYSGLLNVPRELTEAAQVMGARPTAVFWRVILPLSIPGLLSGWLLVFALSMSAYIQPAVLGGPAYFVLATTMYQQLMFVLNWPFAAATGIVLLLLSLGLSYLPQRLLRRGTIKA